MHRGERGVAALEFALVLPVLLLVLFATIEFGWLLTARLVLSQAVAEGARAGGQARDWLDEDPRRFAESVTREAYWLAVLDPASLEIDILPRSASAPRRIEVAVSAPYEPLVGYVPASLLPETLSARAVAVLR